MKIVFFTYYILNKDFLLSQPESILDDICNGNFNCYTIDYEMGVHESCLKLKCLSSVFDFKKNGTQKREISYFLEKTIEYSNKIIENQEFDIKQANVNSLEFNFAYVLTMVHLFYYLKSSEKENIDRHSLESFGFGILTDTIRCIKKFEMHKKRE